MPLLLHCASRVVPGKSTATLALTSPCEHPALVSSCGRSWLRSFAWTTMKSTFITTYDVRFLFQLQRFCQDIESIQPHLAEPLIHFICFDCAASILLSRDSARDANFSSPTNFTTPKRYFLCWDEIDASILQFFFHFHPNLFVAFIMDSGSLPIAHTVRV